MLRLVDVQEPRAGLRLTRAGAAGKRERTEILGTPGSTRGICSRRTKMFAQLSQAADARALAGSGEGCGTTWSAAATSRSTRACQPLGRAETAMLLPRQRAPMTCSGRRRCACPALYLDELLLNEALVDRSDDQFGPDQRLNKVARTQKPLLRRKGTHHRYVAGRQRRTARRSAPLRAIRSQSPSRENISSGSENCIFTTLAPIEH